MKIKYDEDVDVAYIYLVGEIGPGEVAQTIPVDVPEGVGSVYLDFNSEGRLLGIEVLQAKKTLPENFL